MIRINRYRKEENMKTYVKREKNVEDICILENWKCLKQALKQSEIDIENGDFYELEETLEKMNRIIEEAENGSKNL